MRQLRVPVHKTQSKIRARLVVNKSEVLMSNFRFPITIPVLLLVQLTTQEGTGTVPVPVPYLTTYKLRLDKFDKFLEVRPRASR